MDNTEKMLVALHLATNTDDPEKVKRITAETLKEIQETRGKPRSFRLRKQEATSVSTPPSIPGKHASTTSADAYDKWQRKNEK